MWTIGLGLGGLFATLFGGVVAVSGAGLSAGAFVAMTGMGVLGSRLPNLWLSRRVTQRRRAVQLELPDALDLIVVSVEAGLGLDAALAKVTQKLPGALASELGRALEDIRLGLTRKQALTEMARRVDSPELRQFVAAVVQTMEIGGDLGAVLRVQAESARIRRRQRAQEQAMKAPVKMIFPLVFLVFPSILIVVMVPAALRALAVL